MCRSYHVTFMDQCSSTKKSVTIGCTYNKIHNQIKWRRYREFTSTKLSNSSVITFSIVNQRHPIGEKHWKELLSTILSTDISIHTKGIHSDRPLHRQRFYPQLALHKAVANHLPWMKLDSKQECYYPGGHTVSFSKDCVVPLLGLVAAVCTTNGIVAAPHNYHWSYRVLCMDSLYGNRYPIQIMQINSIGMKYFNIFVNCYFIAASDFCFAIFNSNRIIKWPHKGHEYFKFYMLNCVAENHNFLPILAHNLCIIQHLFWFDSAEA